MTETKKHCVTCGKDGHTYTECPKVDFLSLMGHAMGAPPIIGQSREELQKGLEEIGEKGEDFPEENRDVMEQGYNAGRTAMALELLSPILRQLPGENDACCEEHAYARVACLLGELADTRRVLRRLCEDHAYARVACLLGELADTRRVLRRLCEDHGDNDWDDDLHLADALDKHLGRYLEERPSGSNTEHVQCVYCAACGGFVPIEEVRDCPTEDCYEKKRLEGRS